MKSDDLQDQTPKTGWQWPEPTIPPEFDPENIFTEQNLVAWGFGFGALETESKKAFKDQLIKLGIKFSVIAHTTPLGTECGPDDVSLTKRAEWVTANILNPCRKLINGLSDENRSFLSEWPDAINEPEPDRIQLIHELKRLALWSEQLEYDLRRRADPKGDNSNHTMEYIIDLADKLTSLFSFYFPEKPISRGSPGKNGKMDSHYVAFVRRAITAITGNPGQFDRQIEQAVKLHRL